MRAKYNTLIIPYYLSQVPLYCILKRADMKIWQFVAGGGEGDEIPKAGASRELCEEIGLCKLAMNSLKGLDTIGSVPSHLFKDFKESWKDGVYVIPIYTYAYKMTQMEVNLSEEHVDYQWVTYDQAMELLHFDLDKTALWELEKRIKNNENMSSISDK